MLQRINCWVLVSGSAEVNFAALKGVRDVKRVVCASLCYSSFEWVHFFEVRARLMSWMHV